MKTKARRHHRILRLRVTGGFLDGLDIEFQDGLNCIIGPRGAGKTTVIELLRYAVDAMPGRPGDPLRKRVERMIASNLDDGEVEVTIETDSGATYTISRVVGEDPAILDDTGHPVTGLRVRGGLLFRADVLSQNQIESIAETAHYQLDLIDKFSAGEVTRIAGELEALKTSIDENTLETLPLLAREKALVSELKDAPDVEEKLKGMKVTTGPAAEAINTAHAHKSLRDQELRAIDEIKRTYQEVHRAAKGLQGKLGTEVDALFPTELRKGPNGERVRAIVRALATGAEQTEDHLAGVLAALSDSWRKVKAERAELEGDHAKQELGFRKLVEKHKEAQANLTERTALGKRRNQLQLKQRELGEVHRKLGEARSERNELLAKLSELCDERFEIRNDIAGRLTKDLSPGIHVKVTQCGDRDAYREYLADLLRIPSIRGNLVARKISETTHPIKLVEMIRSGNRETLANTCNLNDNQTAEVFAILSRPENLLELETIPLGDSPTIEFCDRGEYRDSGALSTGQKCTAILPILLMESINPLVIDQPEDNLDNSYVYDRIVKPIRKVLTGRQMIFATHNPTIVVLGESSRVFVMDSNRTQGGVKRCGTVDKCKADIMTILEGGKEAFELRMKKYDY